MTSLHRVFRKLALASLLALGWGWLQGAGAADSCPLQVQLSATRNEWRIGEAIELKLSLSNPGDQPAAVSLSYPSLGGRGRPGIAFSLGPGKPEAALEMDTRESVIEIAPHADWQIRVYLNNYLPALEAGEHKVHWWLDLACLSASNPVAGSLQREGWLQLRLLPAGTAKLAPQLNTYLQALDSSDQWRRLEAIAALSNTSDEAVLPSLQKLYQYGYRNDALHALRKFDGNPQAAAILVQIILASSDAALRNATQLAQAWRSDLPPEALAPSSASDNREARLALIAYMEKRAAPAYAQVLRTLAGAADAGVAQAAQAALSKMPPPR